MNYLPVTTKPENGQRVFVLFESPYTQSREWYVANYINGRFVEGGVLNNIIGWLPTPPTKQGE